MPRQGLVSSQSTCYPCSSQTNMLRPTTSPTTKIGTTSRSQCSISHQQRSQAVKVRMYTGPRRREIWTQWQPSKTTCESTSPWAPAPIRLSHQTHALSPHQAQIPREGQRGRSHSQPQSVAGAWHQDRVHPGVPPARHTLRRDESKGALGRGLLPNLPVEACHHHHPLHPGSPGGARCLHPLHHAPGALRVFFELPPPCQCSCIFALQGKQSPVFLKLGVLSLTRHVIRLLARWVS